MSKVFSVGNTNISNIEISDGEDVCIIVSVNPDRIGEVKAKCKKTVMFNYNNRFPFRINYKEPKRAGNDRIAFATFAYYENIYPSFLIDAGTFITVDYFSGDMLYPVATIPGFITQLKTLQSAFNLRNLTPTKPAGKYPLSPEESLYKGIWENTAYGINTILDHKVETILTGGDAEVLHSILKKGVIIKNAVLLGAYMAFKNGII